MYADTLQIRFFGHNIVIFNTLSALVTILKFDACFQLEHRDHLSGPKIMRFSYTDVISS